MGIISKIKEFFNGDSSAATNKKIKFCALIFVIIVLLYLAISPLPQTTIDVLEEVGSFGGSLGKKVRFADNLVTHVWHK